MKVYLAAYRKFDDTTTYVEVFRHQNAAVNYLKQKWDDPKVACVLGVTEKELHEGQI